MIVKVLPLIAERKCGNSDCGKQNNICSFFYWNVQL